MMEFIEWRVVIVAVVLPKILYTIGEETICVGISPMVWSVKFWSLHTKNIKIRAQK